MDPSENLPPEPAELFGRLLDADTFRPAEPDALRAIVARRDGWRLRALAIALGVVLLAGPAAGYALGHGSRTRATSVVAAAPAGGAKTPQAGQPGLVGRASGSAAAVPGFTGGTGPGENLPPAKQVFVRDTADGIRIRAYLQTVPQIEIANPPAASPAILCPPATTNGAPTCANPGAPVPSGAPIPAPCLPSANLQAQVSNDQVAGEADGVVFEQSTAPFSVVAAQVVGAADPTPIGTVIVRTTPSVASVQMVLANGGTDQMAPIGGYAVLAHGMAGFSGAVLTAFDAAHHAIGTVSLDGGGPIASAIVGGCGVATGVATASSGTAVSGSGSVSSSGPATVGGSSTSP